MAKRRKRSKKWISRVFFLLLLIAAIVVCYFVWDAYFKDEKVIKKEENNTQVETLVDNKEEEKKEELKEEEEEPIKKEEVTQFDGDDPNSGEHLTGVITYLGVSGNDLVVRVNIDQYLTSGNCEIRIIRDGGVLYAESASIIDSAATSTCEGFNIPLSKLSSGNVQVDINVSSGEKTGMIHGETNI